MPDLPTIRWDRPHERDAILAFIADMGFTPRDAATWDGLKMRAVCAWRDGRLVGVLPIEPRPIRVAGDACVEIAHLTCVAVRPDERGVGVGSAMQAFLVAEPGDARWLGVYREAPDSPGYRWYLKNGFVPALHVVSWTRSLGPGLPVEPCGRSLDGCADLWRRTERLGVVDQSRRPLDAWLDAHPYRGRYVFGILPGDGGYAVVGVGKLHSDGPRLDVLDLVAVDVSDARRVLEHCVAFARGQSVASIRVALAADDPLAAAAAELGLAPGWAFDLLIRPLGLMPDSRGWRYASIDFA